SADWKIVDSLEGQGLYKSALEKAEAIQERARKDRNTPQSIKALLYRGKYTTMLEEDGFVKAVQLFEKEEKTANVAEKAVLQSILGQLYSTYLQNQGWKIQDRTPIPDGEGGDLLTWSAAQIERHALELYAASVEWRPLVVETNGESFRDILTPNQNDTVAGQELRPNLYDLLAHRALQYFASSRSYLTEPVYKFEINDPQAFAPREQFLKVNFETKDSSSGKWLALKTYQQVLRNRDQGNSRNLPALIDADLLRLQFVRENFVGEDKDNRYLLSLEYLRREYANEPSAAEIAYRIAEYYYQLQTGDKGAQSKQAVATCEDAIKRFPGTYGAQQCAVLLEQIRSKSLNVQVEEAYLPARNLLVSLYLRNLPEVWVKVVRVPDDPQLWDNIPYQERLNYLNKLQGLQNRTWKIDDPGDYQSHHTEISLEPLPLGNYWVLVSGDIHFDPKMAPVSFANFNCSNLSAVFYNQEGSSRFVVADRQSGLPVPGTKLEFFAREYQNNRNRQRVVGTATSDANGLAIMNLPKNTYATVRASLGKDTLQIGQAQNYGYDKPEASGRQVQFFTDRALYRPGQTVYFKGILFKAQTNGQPQIVPNQPVTVKFLDANQQEKGQLKLRSNEFGTFNGAFTAPATGLTGQMSIQLTEASGQANFNVEEYKRPKFEVTFKPVEGSFKLDETVTVRGEAKAYAGSNLDNVAVHYRVVRQARFPFYDYGWGRKMFPPWRTDQMEVTNGNLTTDANGGFEIKFTAVPDRSVPKKDQPVFDYTVFADVTDINGETRSSQQSVSVAYIALKVDLGLEKEIELDSLHRIAINTTNLAGQFQAASGEITLQRLVEPKTFYINRYWERPDLVTIPKANFVQMFPEYAWKDEDDPEKWDRQDQLIPFAFNTANAKTIDLNGGKVQPGYYYLQLKTKDAFGQDVEIKRVIRVWDKNKPATQFVEPTAVVEKSTLQPGETARIRMGGKAAPLNFFYGRDRDGKLEDVRWLKVNGAGTVELPVTESDRGGINTLL
ncbi:MAG: MG2 domain-containing protein, partial [Saprospiraceae bacterium]